MGTSDTLTAQAREVIENADAVIGAKRMTEGITDKQIFISYKPQEIADFLADKSYKTVAVLLSGDVGFYSGAKGLLNVLSGYDTVLLPGISSAVYFCARLKTPWEDVKLLSLHGKSCNAINYIRRFKKVFMLLNGSDSISELCQKLCYYNMGDTILHIGQRLSYRDEKIITAAAREISSFSFDSLCVVLAENPNTVDLSHSSIPDKDFIRGEVPMTKSEVRAVSLAKLCLTDSSVLYDIGSGTGSVAVEAALRLIDGSVYAIEKNETALKLIENNKLKFAADNITVVSGSAPKATEDLPVPTHAFIGGSGGGLADIIDVLLAKNKNIKIVANVIALNSLAELLDIIDKKSLKADIVSLSVARDRMAGAYRLMTSLNPVYIITIN